jgi:hypothetical protein
LKSRADASPLLFRYSTIYIVSLCIVFFFFFSQAPLVVSALRLLPLRVALVPPLVVLVRLLRIYSVVALHQRPAVCSGLRPPLHLLVVCLVPRPVDLVATPLVSRLPLVETCSDSRQPLHSRSVLHQLLVVACLVPRRLETYLDNHNNNRNNNSKRLVVLVEVCSDNPRLPRKRTCLDSRARLLRISLAHQPVLSAHQAVALARALLVHHQRRLALALGTRRIA